MRALGTQDKYKVFGIFHSSVYTFQETRWYIRYKWSHPIQFIPHILTHLILSAAQSSLDDSLERRCFTRRTDLPEAIRLTLPTALNAMLNHPWGTITELSNEYGVSRTFIYSLPNGLKKLGQFLFEDRSKDSQTSASTQEKKQSIKIGFKSLVIFINYCQHFR